MKQQTKDYNLQNIEIAYGTQYKKIQSKSEWKA